MKLFKNLFVCVGIMIMINLNYSCERDDICTGDGTTPFLIIKFIDDDTQTEIKTPSELEVRALGDLGEGIDPVFPLPTLTDSIFIPLRTDMTTTGYEFVINSITTNDGTTPVPSNSDTINFTYTTDDEYVSSACGFKVNFRDFDGDLVIETGGANWIKNITIQTEDVTNETEAHILIFH
ncbi:hypothetical protein D1816_01675 [Aquimarina sp. AD10]|uniref:DUF6452 family protein n=1 Tax=Aquimarina sp. AD10 TaxID=1714849 RepID=UPI000E49F35C|nr:DUF6452 family protein [Aquimarina sp. AD10]AXT59109.1 hypothetical protein D1816_01675 [Aquimarina sp. AD10]